MLRRWWERRKAAAFPSGAVTFHLRTWSRGALDSDAAAQAASLMAAHGFRELVLLHGNAIELDGRLLVVAGPSGVGKSTVCRALVRRAGARLVEDGLVLAGSSGRAWTVVETGTLGVLSRSSRLARTVRRLTGTNRSIYRQREARCPFPRLTWHRRAAGELPFSLAILLTLRRGGAFTPALRLLDHLVVLEHPEAPLETYRIARNGRLTPVADPAAEPPPGLAVTRLSSVGARDEVQARLVSAMRRTPGAAGASRPQRPTA